MDSQFWLWFDAIAMLVGGLAILFIGKQRNGHEQSHTIYHGIVPIIAACSYLAMAVGQGSVILLHASAPVAGVVVGGGRLFYFARYIDWAFTTPLLLLALAYSAMHSSLRRGGLVAGLLLSDLLMIVTAFLFAATDNAPVKWTWFIVSCAAFLAVLYVMWVPLLRENATERPSVQADYRRNAAMLSVLWIAYPIILFFDSDGADLISPVLGVALIAIIDLVSKVVYGLLTVAGTKKLVTEDLAAGTTPSRMRAAA